MGLLDDAIREHLELKRRHGASPDEVERQEREALGAARQGEFAPPAEGAEPAEEPVAAEPPPEDATRVMQPPAEDQDEVPPPPDEPAVPERGHEAAAPGYDEDPWLDEEPDEVPAEESLEPPAQEPPAAEGEDVLEETPEFLQETPEHDRLWFEQRPPRDFDWDK